MTSRRFVLEPLAAIRPDLILPGHSRSIRDYLRDLPDHDSMRTIPW
jgi:7,8-dihydro-6-hydroxymethylpterin-pyrophosphokinase